MAAHHDMSQQTATTEEAWLDAFHSGDRACMAALYEGQFDVVDRVVGGILSGFDRENVVHEVFFRLLSDDGLRRQFQGGSLASWLRVMARNLALDHVRRRRLEVPLFEHIQAWHSGLSIEDRLEQRTHVRLTLERFRSHVLPAKWERDRKSTRLNSSHQITSYAVFCLKKEQDGKASWISGSA